MADRCFYCNSEFVQQDGRTWCPDPYCTANVGNPRFSAEQEPSFAQRLREALGYEGEVHGPWPTELDVLFNKVRLLREAEERKVKVEEIVTVLRGMDIMTGIMDRIEIQISDETVYEHLKTCASILDDEDHKRMLLDAAELFADEFCK